MSVLTIIVPCYNEKNTILSIINRINDSSIKNKEIIIVDDFSTDGTREILEKEIKPIVSRII